ncbi:MAG: hypothetical protein RLZZ252_317, partial [Bacteroidota bacterium]
MPLSSQASRSSQDESNRSVFTSNPLVSQIPASSTLVPQMSVERNSDELRMLAANPEMQGYASSAFADLADKQDNPDLNSPKGTYEGLKNSGKTAIATSKAMAGNYMEKGKKAISSVGSKISNWWNKPKEVDNRTLKEKVLDFGSSVKSAATTSAPTVAKGLWGGLKGAAKAVGSKMVDPFIKVANSGINAKDAYQANNLAGSRERGLKGEAEGPGMLDKLKGFGSSALSAIKSTPSVLKSAGTSLVNGAKSLPGRLSNWWNKPKTDTRSFGEKVSDFGKSSLAGIKSIPSGIKSMGAKISSGISSTKERISNWWNTPKETNKDLGISLAKGLTSERGKSAVINAATGIKGIADIASGKSVASLGTTAAIGAATGAVGEIQKSNFLPSPQQPLSLREQFQGMSDTEAKTSQKLKDLQSYSVTGNEQKEEERRKAGANQLANLFKQGAGGAVGHQLKTSANLDRINAASMGTKDVTAKSALISSSLKKYDEVDKHREDVEEGRATLKPSDFLSQAKARKKVVKVGNELEASDPAFKKKLEQIDAKKTIPTTGELIDNHL